MFSDDTRSKINDIVQGIVIEGARDNCTAIRNLLCTSFATSTTVKTDFESKSIAKKEQAQFLEEYSTEHHLWIESTPGVYLTRGGEARVYLAEDKKSVVKLNDGIYFATWLEFLNSILLHNLIFENTTYTLLGFIKENNVLYAVLKQPFIISDVLVDLEDVKKFLIYNGFENVKRQDYLNKKLGLILEDMHDENVIVNSETLFFIDTVFYTIKPI